MKVSDLFEIKRGNKFDFNKMKISKDSSVNFVSRTSQNNGVVCKVDEIDKVKAFPQGLITVTLGGSFLLSAFVQEKPFYTAQNIDVLIPKKEMTIKEKLFYCYAISSNRFRYRAFGREANKTLKDIEIPDEMPEWINKIDIKKTILKTNNKSIELDVTNWKEFKLIDFFEMHRGKYYEKDCYSKGDIPIISSKDSNNGIMDNTNLNPTFKGNSLTIGKVGMSTFYQASEFCATSDVTILIPKFKFNKYIGLFLKTVIEIEKNKWSYGRQIRLGDCKKIVIKLPCKNNEPDWSYMEYYIKSLPYGDRI